VTAFSLGTGVPKEATWIFVPQIQAAPQPLPDYELTGVTLRLDLTKTSGHELQVELRLHIFNKSRTYGLGILQPLRVAEDRTTASNSMGSATKPLTTVTPSGTYFTRSQFTFDSVGSLSVYLNIPLYDAITFRDFGRRGTGFTFGSGYGIRAGDEVNQFMRDTTPDAILNQGLTLSVIYPSIWQLSLSETFPWPDKEFAVGQDRAVAWSLNFNAVLPAYFVTVTLIWSIPDELKYHNLATFGSGVMIALGSGIVTESTTRRRRQSNTASSLHRPQRAKSQKKTANSRTAFARLYANTKTPLTTPTRANPSDSK